VVKRALEEWARRSVWSSVHQGHWPELLRAFRGEADVVGPLLALGTLVEIGVPPAWAHLQAVELAVARWPAARPERDDVLRYLAMQGYPAGFVLTCLEAPA